VHELARRLAFFEALLFDKSARLSQVYHQAWLAAFQGVLQLCTPWGTVQEIEVFRSDVVETGQLYSSLGDFAWDYHIGPRARIYRQQLLHNLPDTSELVMQRTVPEDGCVGLFSKEMLSRSPSWAIIAMLQQGDRAVAWVSLLDQDCRDTKLGRSIDLNPYEMPL
jgi:hypothetical protein